MDKYGKPNEKTPANWRDSYIDYAVVKKETPDPVADAIAATAVKEVTSQPYLLAPNNFF